jgi:hypothetical protein
LVRNLVPEDIDEQQIEMLDTIKVPNRLSAVNLQSALPKPCYPDERPNSPRAWPVLAEDREKRITEVKLSTELTGSNNSSSSNSSKVRRSSLDDLTEKVRRSSLEGEQPRRGSLLKEIGEPNKIKLKERRPSVKEYFQEKLGLGANDNNKVVPTNEKDVKQKRGSISKILNAAASEVKKEEMINNLNKQKKNDLSPNNNAERRRRSIEDIYGQPQSRRGSVEEKVNRRPSIGKMF